MSGKIKKPCNECGKMYATSVHNYTRSLRCPACQAEFRNAVRRKGGGGYRIIKDVDLSDWKNCKDYTCSNCKIAKAEDCIMVIWNPAPLPCMSQII